MFYKTMEQKREILKNNMNQIFRNQVCFKFLVESQKYVRVFLPGHN